MDKDLQEFVQQHIVKKSTPIQSQQVSNTDIATLLEAGFSYHAKKYKEENQSRQSLSKIEGIILNVPKFKEVKFKLTGMQYVIISVIVSSAIIVSTALITRIFALLISLIFTCSMMPIMGLMIVSDMDEPPTYKQYKIKNNKYLWECKPSEYTGPITTSVAKASIQAQQQNLVPRVWFVASKKEVKGGLIVPEKPIDPLLVGYSAYDIHQWHNKKVALLAVWGEDLEDIDALFSKSN